MNPFTDRIGLTPAEAAKLLGIHRRQIDAAIKAGKLKRARFGINPVILVSDLWRWARARAKVVRS